MRAVRGEDYVENAPVRRGRFWLLAPLALLLGAALVLRAGDEQSERQVGDPVPSPSTEYVVLGSGYTRTSTEEGRAFQTELRSVWDEDVTVERVVPVDDAGREVSAAVAVVTDDRDAIQRVFTQPSPAAPVVLPARGTRYLLVRFDPQCSERPAVGGFRVTVLVGGQRVEPVLRPASDGLRALTSPVCPP